MINMVTNLMMSAKLATPDLHKIKVFWKKGFNIIIAVYDITNKILSRDSNCNVNVVMWPKFGNSIISVREEPQFYKDLTKKTAFLEEWSWFKFNNWELALGTNLKFYTNVVKGLKLRARKFWGLISTFAEVTKEKLVGGPFWLLPPS